MFSGIIEATTKVLQIEHSGTNSTFTFSDPYKEDLYIDQSIAHNGTCLTVIEINKSSYKVVAIKETMDVTNLGNLKVGDHVNLERCIRVQDRLDGHIVQGHVDATALLCKKEDMNGSWELTFEIPNEFESLVIHRGSICLNGISLTIKALTETLVTVAIIPYTYEYTNFKYLSKGDIVNVEFDMMGKYVNKYMAKIKS